MSLQKDLNGTVLPTQRNRDLVRSLFKTHKDLNKVAEIIGEDYYAWVKAVMFDPRQETVFFSSPGSARQAEGRIKTIKAFDRQYQNN